MGKNKDGVLFPVAPKLSEMSEAYLKYQIYAEICRKLA